MKKKSITVGTIVILAIGAGGFLGGMQYQKSKAPSFAERRLSNFRGQSGQGDHQDGQDSFRGRFAGLGRPIAGEVISKDSESITVKLQDGGSKIVFISDTTTVRKTEEGDLDDIVEGIQVVIFGSENDDGSVTAQNVQIGEGFGLDHQDDLEGNQ